MRLTYLRSISAGKAGLFSPIPPNAAIAKCEITRLLRGFEGLVWRRTNIDGFLSTIK
ncbi:protein of unknown function [Bradyrhizobium vignae]|uniref:Uncharacterized protein n=1 Tax=Bradyrhizobium vignae TaxID=1549949 RepID=A0A2U3PQ94_9BRAD|nr:protein of unknown function [Bradyrhizobium vignae]